MRSVTEAEAQPRIQSIGRGFAVLFAIAASDRGLQASEIVNALGLDRQTTYHILQSLGAIGAITKSADRRYVLGLKIADLIEGFRRHLDSPERLAPLVRTLAQETGETAYAVGWMRGEIAVLATARGTKSISAVEVPQGYASNAHARASGKLLLALADPAHTDEYFKRHELTRLTSKTITKRPLFEKELKKIRQERVSIERGEFSPELCCMAMPIGDFGSSYVLAISVPSERFEQNLTQYKSAMRRVGNSRT